MESDLNLIAVKIGETGLDVDWSNSEQTTYAWMWLRDHGEDAQSLDVDTLQRKVDTFAIDPELCAVSAELDDDGKRVRLKWSDSSPPSEVSSSLLAAMAGLAPSSNDPARGRAQKHWAAGTLPESLPSVAFDALMTQDADLKQWLENVYAFGFSLVDGVPSTEEATRQLAQRMGYIRETIFGGLWTLSAEVAAHDDTAYSTQYLEPHTDATYCHDAPGLQMFNCIEFDGDGGESVLVDGFALGERMRAECPEDFDVLTRTVVPGRYIEPGVCLMAERPALRTDAGGRLVQVSFNNYDRAPFMLEPAEMAAFYRAYSELHRRIIDRDNWLKIPLRPGMALIFDNWRLLHGRMGYTGKRVFCGCYHNREEFESRFRLASAL